MRKSIVSCLLFVSAAGVAVAQAAQAGNATPRKMGGAVVPAWSAIEKTVRSTWAERYPRETIVAITKVGDPKFTEEAGKTETMSSTSGSFDWGDFSWNETNWSTTIKGREGSYLRQTLVATVERPNKTRGKFTIAALYKLVGAQWQFVELPVGKVEELAGAGSPTQPSDVEAAKIFADAWTRTRADFNVQGAKGLGKEFHQYGGRYWLSYKLSVSATGTDKAPSSLKGKRVTCEPSSDNSVLKWDKDAAKWVADDSMIGYINETAYCTEP